MIMQDKLEKERNDAKNAVEEYVYEFRDKLSGPYEKFVCEKVGYGFRNFCENTDTKYLCCIPWSNVLKATLDIAAKPELPWKDDSH